MSEPTQSEYFVFGCIHCRQHYEALRSTQGCEYTCQSCGKVFTVPNPEYVPQPKPKLVIFDCPCCGQGYDVTEKKAGSAFNCVACGSAIKVPHPARGYYAQPSASQKRVASELGIDWSIATFRGVLARMIDEAKEMKRAQREHRQGEREFIEADFNRGGEWAEFYEKPTGAQFRQVYDWLDQNLPNWSELDFIDALESMFPELKK